MSEQCFKVNIHNKWAQLEMAKPERLNAIDAAMLQELEDLLKFLGEGNIKAVVLTGQGKAFAAGADIKAMAAMDPEAAREFSERGNKVFQMIEEHPAVFIAAVNGYALGGGCELAMACDLRYASREASFGQPEIDLGVIPGFGGTQRLPRLVGLAKAKEWIFTGRRFSAQEALAEGLVSKVVAAEELLPTAQALAQELAKKSGPILALAKKAIGIGACLTPKEAGEEAAVFGECFATHDGPEGLRAFVEKRSPNFQDR